MDPISNMIIQMKNAGNSGQESVTIPYSNLKHSIAQILKKEKFIKDVEVTEKKNHKVLMVSLFLENRIPKIQGVKRLSKPSKRIYKKSTDLRGVKSGYGALILSTSQGVMSGREAKRAGLGEKLSLISGNYMSRIGKQIITLPEKTELTVTNNTVVVKGPLGELSRTLHPQIEVKTNNREVTVHPKKESLETRALWGTYAAHLSNMVSGVNKPFEKKLILEGIGYKSEVSGDKITLALGFSHPVKVAIPAGLKVTAEKNLISISGPDKEQVGQFAAQLRALKKPEPYKGKGMRYEKEVIRRKQGKKSL